MQDSPKLSESLFWDSEPRTIDFDNNARYVIEKVVSRGKFSDWLEIKRYYGLEKIKECALRLRDLNPKTISFLSLVLDVPREEFKCYKLRQLNPRLSIY